MWVHRVLPPEELGRASSVAVFGKGTSVTIAEALGRWNLVSGKPKSYRIVSVEGYGLSIVDKRYKLSARVCIPS